MAKVNFQQKIFAKMGLAGDGWKIPEIAGSGQAGMAENDEYSIILATWPFGEPHPPYVAFRGLLADPLPLAGHVVSGCPL